jgi:crossover junction endodeoxyribonuclease RusA
MSALSLTFSYPPSANRLWRNVDGKTLKSSAYRLWLKANETWGLKTITGPYDLTIVVTPPDKRARDLDNLAKPIGDLLQATGAVANDSNLERLTMSWDRSGPACVRVVIKPYQPEQGE